MSVQELADTTGLDRSTIYKIEKGGIGNPSLELLLTLQHGLMLASIEELLGDFPSGEKIRAAKLSPPKEQ